jgi:hypothetical protein
MKGGIETLENKSVFDDQTSLQQLLALCQVPDLKQNARVALRYSPLW